MRAYRVTFDRSRKRKYEPMFMDVYAKNAKEACEHVLDVLYYDSYNGYHFYPFHRRAKKIDPDIMCDGLRCLY